MRRPERTSYLLIYAPRREVLEIWPARSGKCLRTFKCGSNSALLAPPVQDKAASGCAQDRDCFVLNGTTGQLFSVSQRLQAV